MPEQQYSIYYWSPETDAIGNGVTGFSAEEAQRLADEQNLKSLAEPSGVGIIHWKQPQGSEHSLVGFRRGLEDETNSVKRRLAQLFFLAGKPTNTIPAEINRVIREAIADKLYRAAVAVSHDREAAILLLDKASELSEPEFPRVKEVCELFDVTVLFDRAALSDDESDDRSKPVYALGWNSDLAAGIRYGTITNWFDSMDLLESFCARNIERFRAVAADEDAPAPDASDWS